MSKDPFEYQRPTEAQVNYITAVRLGCKELSELIDAIPMDGRCKALARTKLEELSMWANKGIVFAPDATVPARLNTVAVDNWRPDAQ